MKTLKTMIIAMRTEKGTSLHQFILMTLYVMTMERTEAIPVVNQLPPNNPITSILDWVFCTAGAILEGDHSPEKYNKTLE